MVFVNLIFSLNTVSLFSILFGTILIFSGIIFMILFLRWICVYPAYINSKKTRQEGRCLKKSQCVSDPTFQEIKDVLSVSNLRIGVENKQYPRERSKVDII